MLKKVNEYVFLNMPGLRVLLRRFGLMKIADDLRFGWYFIKTFKLRRQFRKAYPGIKLPPPYYVYETFNLNYFSFYHASAETAAWLTSKFRKYKQLQGVNILDWGCGPGRVIRHIPPLLEDSSKCYGTDYNKKYIQWCRKHIAGVSFSVNKLQPPLPYEADSFDIIYGISIFTHLSEAMHYAWIDELMRTLKKDGILLVTMQGEAFVHKLSPEEQQKFEQGKLVVKGNTTEGHRTYGAFQPPAFVRSLVTPYSLLEHVPGTVEDGKPEQDVWIISKNK